MAINNLIAQGIAPIGRDLPDVANMLAHRRMQEQQNAIATQNAEQYRRSLDMQSQAREQEMAQRKAAEARGWIEANYDAIKARPDAMPKLLALAKQKQYLPPDFPDNATLEDVALHFGVQAPAAPVPFEQTPDGLKFNEQRRQFDERMKLDRAKFAADQRGGGAGKEPNKQLVTRPTADGQQQDYAFNPQTSQLEPVGQPYAKTAPLSPKDTTTAKQKLTQIAIARKQLQNAKAKFAEIKDSLSAGAGGGLLPTPKGKAFDAAIDGMRGSITSLTRVPGVGAMSDYETRLDQAKFPTRNDYEDVISQKLEQLDALISGLDTGYRDLLGGQSDTAAPDAPKAAPKRVRVDAQGNVIGN